ncbi:MAG TPA: DUF2141 domain-containing protein [Bryobacteraceae bacterium]|nr:DUF2141 domain-containing protein [Bryobacteraceae bacterium]
MSPAAASLVDRLPAFAVLLIALLVGAAARSPAQERNSTSRLTIVAEGVRNSRGVVGVLLFRSARGWPEDVGAAFRSEAARAHPGITTMTFEDLPPGTYAIVLLHDENENKKLDKNFFGVPREGWGMSNNPKAHGAAPAFSRARFVFRSDTRLRIHLNY